MADSPDLNANSLLTERVDPLRYDGQTDDPREVAGILNSFMPSHSRVLDVGCGTGSITTIANRGKQNIIFAIEPDAARARVAASRGFEVTCGFLDESYFVDHGQFDVIMMSDVLEHLPDPGAMMMLVRKGLRPGGRVLISVPNVAHWSVRMNLLFGNFDYADVGIRDATHLRWFTRKTIVALMVACGFEVLQIAQSAGTDLPEYSRRPWRWIPTAIRSPLIRVLKNAMPLMFGCQHVLACTEVGGGQAATR